MTLIYKAGDDWSYDKIQRIYDECEIIGKDELRLTWYPNQFEIVNFENMLDVYSSIGMPMMYNHWSFGKSFVQNSNMYKQGRMGLALEMVINSNPCINYLMDENTMTGQALVIAHAAIGHNSFFKNNYLFKQWTSADSIIDYLGFAKKYIASCEEKYGAEEVERVLDAAHALMNHGVDRYQKPKTLSVTEEESKQKIRDEHHDRVYDELWTLVPKKNRGKVTTPVDRFLPNGPEENLLYFIEKNSPVLKSWQRELVRIVRKISQYFSPQAQSKIANEGWASTVHYYIMNRLHEKGMIDNGAFLEFLHLHTSVVFQPEFDTSYFSGFNPYHLGFNIFKDLKRMSLDPTEEDRQWFPDYAGGDWVENWHHAYENYRDDSLIQQFMSPALIREMRLFAFLNNKEDRHIVISDVHNERGYRNIRNFLSEENSIGKRLPDIQVTGVDFNTRKCILTHSSTDKVLLTRDESAKTLGFFQELWGFPVVLQTRDRKTDNIINDISIGDE